MPHATQAPSDTLGRGARSPLAIPMGGWKAVLMRTWKEAGNDNIGLISAGVAFYGFLSIVPLLGAIVLIYGLVAEPKTVMENVQSLTSVMPADAARLIGEQLMTAVKSADGKKGFGLLIALGLALYGAMKGAGSIVTALNVAYEEEEGRGFVKLNLLQLAITAGAVVLALVALLSVAAVALLDTLMPWAPDIVLTAIRLGSYLLLAALGAVAAATLYRYGPDRDHAKWSWLTAGSLGATAIWLAMTAGFGLYVANFGSYDATYGSLGGIVVLLTWLSLSAYVFILGAELNSELEHQTAEDTTTGADRPMGERGAVVADTLPGDGKAPSPLSDSPEEKSGTHGDAPRDAAVTIATTRMASGGWTSGLATAGGLMLLRRGRLAGVALVVAGALTAWAARPTDQPEPV